MKKVGHDAASIWEGGTTLNGAKKKKKALGPNWPSGPAGSDAEQLKGNESESKETSPRLTCIAAATSAMLRIPLGRARLMHAN